MIEDELIERIANDANERAHGRPLPLEWEYNQAAARRFWKNNLSILRDAGFEVIDKEELAALRARQAPPGWVCVDPEGEIALNYDCIDALGAAVIGDEGIVNETETCRLVVRAYLHAARALGKPQA